MMATVISRNGDKIKIQVELFLKDSMLESEEAILDAVNDVGALATEEALHKFDADGSPIKHGDVKFTSKNKDNKTYQTPYGSIATKRHVYQTSKGGKIFCPLEEKARIIQGATPRFAKLLSHKYSNLGAPRVIEDLAENHGCKIATSYLQNVTDFVGSIAQTKEHDWEYSEPELTHDVSTIGISLDGAYVLTIENGYRESMVGTISLYDKMGDRLHTTYIAASPEYGKTTFFDRLAREAKIIKTKYPNAYCIGVADGAQDNWVFLNKHTDEQIIDFWHASEYLGKASYAVFNKKIDEAKRKEWLEEKCHLLKHKQGAATRILNELRKSPTKGFPEVVQDNLSAAISYFKNNISCGRMSYYKFGKNNFPIGSGVTEAACKTIIKQRLCASGMRWKKKGIKMILSLRTLVHTKGRWTQFWEKINQFGVPVLS